MIKRKRPKVHDPFRKLKRGILKDIETVKELINRGDLPQATKCGFPLLQSFAQYGKLMPDALEDVRDIAIELLKPVINTDDEVVAQIVKEAFYQNSHLQLISKQVGWVRHLEEQANRASWLDGQLRWLRRLEGQLRRLES